MNRLETVIDEMVTFGFTKDQINEFINLSTGTIAQMILSDFADKAEDAKLDEYKSKLETVVTEEQKGALLGEIAKEAYGEQAEEKKLEKIAEVLEGYLAQAKEMRDLHEKYKAGDPDAVNKIQAAMNSDEFKQLQQDVQGMQQPSSPQ